GTMGKYHRIMRRQCLELVWCRGEGNSGDLGDAFGYFFGKAHWRIKPGANCGAALRQSLEAGQGQLDTLYRGGDLRSIAGKFLAKGEGSGVLRMRTPDLDDVVKRLGLGVQRLMQAPQSGQQVVNDALGTGDVHGRRKGIVR